MDALESKALEEAMKFGKKIGNIDRTLGGAISIFDSLTWSEKVKRVHAEGLDGHRQFVREITETVDQKYSGIGVAQEAKSYAQKKLVELEEAARPYLE